MFTDSVDLFWVSSLGTSNDIFLSKNRLFRSEERDQRFNHDPNLPKCSEMPQNSQILKLFADPFCKS